MHAASAASDMMMETKILMNLAPHPNISQIYGVTAAGSDAFLSRGKDGFYIILDRLSSTMTEKLETWREQQEQEITTRKAKGDDDKAIALEQHKKRMQRLEVALDVGSALLFLSDRQIVFHLRPEKIGFDVRYNRIKLCDFGQARENGQLDQAPSLTKTDDIRTLAYVAPEVLCQAPVTVAADVYAYGVVLWEILSLERPFDRLSRSDHFEKVVMNGERPPMSPTIPKTVQTLIEKCWDPYLRPTMKKVYDTVEEILLFQDDKPELSVLPVLTRPPLESATSATDVLAKALMQEAPAGSSSKPRTLRRTKTEETPYAGKTKSEKPAEEPRRRRRHHNEEAPMKDRSKTSNHGESGGRVSRKNRHHKSSNHEKTEKSGKSSSHDVIKDKSRNSQNDSGVMRDESKDRHTSGAPMKDRSKQRTSRRSRTSISKKQTSEEASQGTKTTAGDTQTTAGEEKHHHSLPELLQENEGKEEYVGESMKVMTSPSKEKKTVKPTPTLPTIPAVEGEGESEPRKEPGLHRSHTSTQATATSKGPDFGRSQTSSGQRRSRKVSS